MPKFSILMPCFNAVPTLNATLASIVRQRETGWELICVDDGSTDTTRALLAGWARMDPRIRVLRNPGKGPSAARNFAARHARGEILCFCDADDLWVPGKLGFLRAGFAAPDTDALFGQIAFFRQAGRADTRSTVPAQDVDAAMLLAENPVCTLSNLSVRRAVFQATGGFDQGFVHNEDLDWLLRLVAGGGTLRGQDRLHVWYRTSPGGLSSDLAAMQAARARLLGRARRLGVTPDRRAEAVYLRYLARRALRLGQIGSVALRLSLAGMRQSPRGFLTPLRRGAPTLIASVLAPLLPAPLRRHWLAR